MLGRMNCVAGDDLCSSEESSSEDSLEELKELESRLYSVVHYNNLSEAVPSDIPEGFKIDISKSNEITVSLTDDITSRIGDGLDELQADGRMDISVYEENYVEDQIFSGSNSWKESNEFCSSNKEKNVVKGSSDLVCYSQNDDDDIIIISCDSFNQRECSEANAYKSEIKKLKMTSDDKNNSSVYIFEHSTGNSQNSVGPFSNSINSSDLITNFNHVTENNKVEEIVISSDDDRPSHITNNCTHERNKVKSKKKGKLEKQCPKKWTSSMVKFYCKISRKKLNFDSVKLLKEMRATIGQERWFLNDRDLSGKQSKRHRKRCSRCRQFDHDVKHCTEQIKPITCYMCGENGHRESRCPHKKCLTCGKSNSVYVQMCAKCLKDVWNGKMYCTICYSNHHTDNLCPDVWRGFHTTTKEDAIVMPLSNDSLRKLCSNCGKSGHLDYECQEVNNSVYVRSKPYVSNYVAVAGMFASNKENLTLHIRLNEKEGSALSSEEGYEFLQSLSNTIKARLELVIESSVGSLTVNGSQVQCKAVIDKVNSFITLKVPVVNAPYHKHKRKPLPRNRRYV